MQAIYKMNGYAVAVNDEQILESQHKVASLDGTFISPEGANLIIGREETE